MPVTIGETLKKTRQQRNLSLEQAASATRIKIHHLEALENDQRSSMPSQVQARGFLKLYANYLELDGLQLQDVWDGKIILEPPLVSQGDIVEPAVETTPVDASSVPGVPPRSGSAWQMIFWEIGDLLRQRREALGISLEDVERFTHVRIHYLKALEDGRIDDMPSPVQARGMLNNYAHFLDLDSDQVLLRFAEGLQERLFTRHPSVRQTLRPAQTRALHNPPPTGLRRWLTPDLLVGGLAIVVIFVFVVWNTAQIASQRNTETARKTTALSLVSQAAPTEGLDLTPSLAAIENTSLPAGNAAPIQPPANVDIFATATIPVISDDPLQVYIVAHQRGWLQVIADTKVIFNGRLIPGNAYPFSASEILEIRTGNAAAVQVFFNRTDLGIMGGVGAAAGMIFTRSGILTPTPRFSPTPTQLPTYTPTLSPSPTQAPPTPTVTPLIP
jgi:cytoskeleton protein RodZ